MINTLVGAINSGLAEALNLGRRNGLEWDAMIDLIASSAVASPYIASKVDKLKRRDWTPAATVSLIAKDLDMALDMGRSSHSFLPLAALTRQLLAAVEAKGKQEQDMCSVLEVYEYLDGISARMLR